MKWKLKWNNREKNIFMDNLYWCDVYIMHQDVKISIRKNIEISETAGYKRILLYLICNFISAIFTIRVFLKQNVKRSKSINNVKLLAVPWIILYCKWILLCIAFIHSINLHYIQVAGSKSLSNLHVPVSFWHNSRFTILWEGIPEMIQNNCSLLYPSVTVSNGYWHTFQSAR